jgi:hypothetical protein
MKKLFVCALAVAMVFAFTAPTMAADWNFYGSARFATFSNDVDPQTAGVESDADTDWSLQGNARIGANVSAGDVGGRFEYGYGATPTLRILYGSWNFGAGTLIVGQDYTPIAEFYSNQVWAGDEDMLGTGMAYTGRRGQIKLRFGGFDVAFVTPVTQASLNTTAGGTITAVDNDVALPQLMMSYKFATDMFSIKPYFAYSTFDFNTGVTSAGQQESVDSMVFGVGGKVNFGPAYFAANVWGGTNAANLGMYMQESDTASAIVDPTGKIVDADTLAYALVLGFKLSDMWSFEAGYGSSQNEIDYAGQKLEDPSFTYYINTSITLAPGVFIVPEFGVQSMDEVKLAGLSAKETETTYFGAKWQINF